MKKYFSLSLLILNMSCFCMDMIIKITSIQHEGPVFTATSQNKIIFFTTEEKSKKRSLELYDTSVHKKIKTIHDIGIASPHFNKKKPYIFALMGKKDKVYSLYDLSKNTEKKLTTGKISYFLLDGTKFLITTDTTLNLYDTESNSLKTHSFKNQIFLIRKNSDQYLMIIFENDGLHLYDVKNESIKHLIIYENLTHNGVMLPYAFKNNSKLFAFFDPKEPSIIVTDLKNDMILAKKNISIKAFNVFLKNLYLDFFDATTVLFSLDEIHYILWNIKDDKLEYINLDGKWIIKSISPQKKYISFFKDYFTKNVLIYTIKEKQLTSLEKNGYLDFNGDETYALQQTKKNTFTLYRTDTWKICTCLHPSFNDDGDIDNILFSFSQFSPCGKYIFAAWFETNCLKLYDIEHDTIILKSDFQYTPEPKFYKNNLLLFAQDETTFVIYDYHIDKKIEITTEEPITRFSINGDLLILSSGTQTELYDLSDVTYIRKKLQNFEDFDLNFLYN